MKVKRGDRVSLIPNKRPYYFQGKEGINLKVLEEESAIIPDSISNENLERINYAIEMNHLVVGWGPGKEIEIPKDENLVEILQQGRKKIDAFIYELVKSKKINGNEKVSKLEKLIELEKAGKNKVGQTRVSVIALIEGELSRLAGISAVEDEEKKEKVEISLTKEAK